MKRGAQFFARALALGLALPCFARAEERVGTRAPEGEGTGAAAAEPHPRGQTPGGNSGSTAKPAATSPLVDLRHLRWTDQGAFAPGSEGGMVKLTLDEQLQRAASRLLMTANPNAGAIVVVHAPSGRVLVWVDRRRGGAPGDVLLEERAPAGSLFKLVTTAALLEKGHVSPDRRVCYSGGMHGIERRHLEAPRTGAVVCNPFWQALGHSRNAVFAQLVTSHLMRTDLQEMADRFGFNRNLPFDVEIPLGTFSVPFGDLEVARTATGFQHSTLSPLGALSLAYAVASGGEAVPIHITESTAAESSSPAPRILDPHTAAQMRRMMEVTVSSGTCQEAFSDPTGAPYLKGIRVAGKTGTLRPEKAPATASWFVGFAPSRKPELVISVLLLNGTVWRRKANAVARDVLRSWFASHGAPGVTDPLEESPP